MYENLNRHKTCVKLFQIVLNNEQNKLCICDSIDVIGLINSNPRVHKSLVNCDKSWNFCYNPQLKRDRMSIGSILTPSDTKKSAKAREVHNNPVFQQQGHHLHPLNIVWSDGHKEYFRSVLTEFRTRFDCKWLDLFHSSH